MPPETPGAYEASRRLQSGELTSAELVETCLAAIEAREDEVQAWTWLDPDHARAQAAAADERRAAGRSPGPLNGIPVGIKDIFDTGDMPTEYGSPVFAGHRPAEDGAAVSRLRAAGAVIMGKTVSTEFALYAPGKTRNPHNPGHTPGGSSSGSAAAVAAGMVPAAIGSQTAGSMIRPASFCGVTGYKPSHGRISRHGGLILSHTLDTIGVFGAGVADIALVADNLTGVDPRDPDATETDTAPLLDTALSDPPAPPRFAFVRSPVWDQASPDTRSAFTALAAALGKQCEEVGLPPAFDAAITHHRTIMFADVARNLGPLDRKHPGKLSEKLQALIAEGREIGGTAYDEARGIVDDFTAALDRVFDGFDAVLTPAAPGPAPAGLDATGDPVFCSLWTLCGVPAVSLPLLEDRSGMPIGVQLVGRKGQDSMLLRTAHWLSRHEQRFPC